MTRSNFIFAIFLKLESYTRRAVDLYQIPGMTLSHVCHVINFERGDRWNLREKDRAGDRARLTNMLKACE